MISTAILAERILSVPEAYDPTGPHHEFKDHGHGYKADMEAIVPGSPLFNDLVDASAEKISEGNPNIPDVIIGIANGGIPWARAIGEKLGPEVEVIDTEKDENKLALLSIVNRSRLRRMRPKRLLYIDDLGTTGASILPVYNQVNFRTRLLEPIPDQSVFYVAARQEKMRRLSRLKIAYSIAVNLNLRTFMNQTACEQEADGLCRNGVELILRESEA